MSAVVDAFAKHLNPEMARLLGVFGYGRVFVRAEGMRLVDDRGREVLDFLAGFGASSLGHAHPRIAARVERLLREKPLAFNHVGPPVEATALAAALAARLPSPLEVSLFASSGAEAVEAGMKLARAATRRPAFVACEGAYHGTTLATLSLIGPARMRDPFGVLLPARHVPFGDLDALERALVPGDVAAFVVEPILGEGGVVLPPPGFLRDAQRACTRAGTLLVLDEIQTGFGRTGSLFAFEREEFTPDVLCLAKALSGGLAPISVAVTSGALRDRAYGAIDRFDLHSSTFGGNALSCAVALETLSALEDDRLVERAARLGDRLLARLRRDLAGHPFVRDVRGRGLLVGVELGPTERGWASRVAPALVAKLSEGVFGQWAALAMLEEGILCQPAANRWDVLKLEPPLIATEAEIDAAAAALVRVLSRYESLGSWLADVAARVGEQAIRRGAWR